MKTKHLLPIAGMLCGCVSALFGAQDAHRYNQGKSHGDQGMYKEILPAAGPRVQDGADVSLSADFIFWGFSSDNLVKVDDSGDKAKSFDQDYHPGFRVGAGMHMCHDGWDTGVTYTWLQGGNKPKSSDNKVFSSHFSSVDWEWGRNSFISQYVTLRPHFGLKGSWQEIKSDPTKTDLSKSWGFGPRAGFDSAWHLTKDWSIYGDFALASLWGQVETTAESHKIDEHKILPALEFGIGLKWDTWTNDEDYHFAVQAGWEHQVWSEAQHIIQMVKQQATPLSATDLNLAGFTLKGRFDF